MIGYFPFLHKDEILYSALARYARLRGQTSSKAIVRELFGGNVKTIFELPCNLSYLSERLSRFELGGPEVLIDKHTMYGYYTSFMNTEDANDVSVSMMGNGGSSVYGKVGVLATDIPLRDFPLICEKCIDESLNNTGDVYINRLHQIPGVFYCHIHNDQVLRVLPINIRSGNRHQFLFDERLYNRNEVKKMPLVIPLNMTNSEKSIHDHIQKGAIYLFGLCGRPGIQVVKKGFRNKLKEIDGISFNGSVRSRLLRELMSERFSDRLAEIYSFDRNNLNFLIDILRVNNRKTHPFKYLLLSAILDIEVSEILNYKPSMKTPLPCLNKLCNKYGQMDIQDYVVTADYKSREPVITVTCPYCGFMYSRKEKRDLMKIGRVKDFGKLWLDELRRIDSDESMSLRAKAKHMHCDPATIKKYTQ